MDHELVQVGHIRLSAELELHLAQAREPQLKLGVQVEVIRPGSHTSVQALEADIRAYAKGWNKDPRPFIWTKTAEQILESTGRLLTRISSAAHEVCA